MNLCGGDLAHPFLTDEDRAADAFCCYGGAEYGPTGCTCWDPVYDLDQAPVDQQARQLLAAGVEAVTRRTRCHDCAFRPDSPERAEGRDLEDLPNFWCHQGIRRPVAFRHPDGRVREVHDSSDYQPPIVDGIPYRADGSPAERCAGWAQAQRRRERLSGDPAAVGHPAVEPARLALVGRQAVDRRPEGQWILGYEVPGGMAVDGLDRDGSAA